MTGFLLRDAVWGGYYDINTNDDWCLTSDIFRAYFFESLKELRAFCDHFDIPAYEVVKVKHVSGFGAVPNVDNNYHRSSFNRTITIEEETND